MPAPIDPRIRQAIVKAYNDGLGTYETIAEALQVGRATVSRVLRLARENQSLLPKPRAGGLPPPIRGRDEARLATIVQENPGATLDQLADLWFQNVKRKISRSSLHRELKRLDYSFKKKRIRAPERLKPEVVEKTRRFKTAMEKLDGRKLVFLDESGCQSNMTRLNSWSKVGSPVECFESPYRQKNITVIGAIRGSGPVAMRSQDKPMTKMDFESFVQKDLAPRLQRGDILVMDNLRSHYSLVARTALKKRGVSILFVPPYSPEFNPIELVWATMKSRIRKANARKRKRSFRHLIAASWRSLAAMDLTSYVRSCGYRLN
jgi:transposase